MSAQSLSVESVANDRAVVAHRVLIFMNLLACVFALTTSVRAQTAQLNFNRVELDSEFRSEGVAVGDFNGDGQMDVAAGFVWYEAPDWQMHAIVAEPPTYDPKGYSNSFVNAAQDLNGDGHTDLMVVDFPG